jgi:hypothetical protein
VIVENTEFVPALPIFGLAHPALDAPPPPTVIGYVVAEIGKAPALQPGLGKDVR